MTQAITTSIRLPSPVRKKLEKISHKLKKGKNGIILEALQNYFDHIDRTLLKEEARRQSLLVGKTTAEDSLWEENQNFEDWKS